MTRMSILWRMSIVLGSAGILPALSGMLPDSFAAPCAKSRRQHAGGSGQNARASQSTVPACDCRS
jgi:hypothetical protein